MTEATMQELANYHEVIDTRSPAEFAEALIADNIAVHLRGALADKPVGWRPLVYCARGGQRSGGMVEIMRRIGWRACRLRGGYKAYRKHVVETIAATADTLKWVVVAGKTGSGKTCLLSALAAAGAQTLDLEGLANHRGSVFGGVGVQPSQRRFESLLFARLVALSTSAPVFVESESRKIGALHIPPPLLTALRQSCHALCVEAELPLRVRHIVSEYRAFCQSRELFTAVLARLAPHAGVVFIRRCQRLYDDGDMDALTACLLTDFYDVGYDKSLRKNYAVAFESPPLSLNPNDAKSLAAAAQAVMARYC